MEIKHIAVLGGALAAVALGLFARKRPRLRSLLATAMGLMLFVDVPDASLGFTEYRGPDSGFMVSLVDLFTVALAVALPRLRGRMPYRGAILLYLAVCLLSTTAASIPSYAFFSIWTFLRVVLVLWVVVRACKEEPIVQALVSGLALGLVYEALLCLQMRYLEGYHQVPGSFSHQNSLGMAVNGVLPIMLVVLLRQRSRLAAVAVGAGAVCIVLTLSRGALAMLVAGMGLTYLGSLWLHGLTRRKAWIAWGGVAAGLIVLGKSADSIVSRFLGAPEESLETRAQFNDAAALMLADHPVRGIGINMYSHVLKNGGYGEEVGLGPGSIDGVAHNIYWLTLAEMGPLGLVAYLWLIAGPLLLAIRGIRRLRGDVRAELLCACAAGMATLHIQGFFEWGARQAVLGYVFAILAGLTAGLARAPAVKRAAASGAAPGTALSPFHHSPSTRTPSRT